ncbi:MAG: methionyl aminopeptidase [Candidatus Omnitrophota bacterium]|jgi:methionyl aminopeptidase
MIIIKNDEELDRMRQAGRVAARIKLAMADKVTPGITTKELDMFARDMMKELGAKSAFKGYRGFPAYTCISVNEVVVHGIPDERRIMKGDIVSIDVGVHVEGFVGDNATTVMVGVEDPEIVRLVEVAEKALEAGISKAVAGGRLTDICHAVEHMVVSNGYSVVRDFVGHGLGRQMHEDPQIPNYGPPGKGPKLRRGMTLAIEPMVNMGVAEVDMMDDGWTVVTADRLPSVHVEHSIAVMDGYAEILTVPGDE